MEAKSLNQLISKIGKNSKSLREDIQTALVGCAYFAQKDRNTDPFNRLFAEVGNGTRKEGMLKWASLYAPVHFKGGEVVLSDKRQKEFDGTMEQFLADLESAPSWFDLTKPEPIANPWDSGKFAEGLALYLETAAKKAEKNGDAELSKLINEAEMLFRVKLNTSYDVVEA